MDKKKKSEDKSAVSISNPQVSHAIGKKLYDVEFSEEDSTLQFHFSDIIVSVTVKANHLHIVTKKKEE